MSRKNTQELLQELDERIDLVKDSEEFKEMLKFFSRFHNYSYQNTILIQMQRPGATYVAGYKQCQDKFNRYVKKGEKGIAILAPYTYKKKVTEVKEVVLTTGEIQEEEVEKTIRKTYFKPVYVFDLTQTEGEPLPTLDIGIEDSYGELIKPLRKFTLNQGISLEFEGLSEGLNGYSKGGKIVIDDKGNNTEKASILVHELGHELLHDKDERLKLSKEIKEMEAEAVAFVVMDHYGVEIKSDKYLALYKKSYDLNESLSRIKGLSSRIISYCDRWFRENNNQLKGDYKE